MGGGGLDGRRLAGRSHLTRGQLGHRRLAGHGHRAEDLGHDKRVGKVQGTLFQDVVNQALEQGVSEVLDGWQEEGLFGTFGHKEGYQLCLGADVPDQLEDGLSRWTLGGNHVDLFVADQGVPEKPYPVALAKPSPWQHL